MKMTLMALCSASLGAGLALAQPPRTSPMTNTVPPNGSAWYAPTNSNGDAYDKTNRWEGNGKTGGIARQLGPEMMEPAPDARQNRNSQ
ncbi:MAG: hypothetical protein R6X19_06205 [Kiritimatiellia bacterium]